VHDETRVVIREKKRRRRGLPIFSLDHDNHSFRCDARTIESRGLPMLPVTGAQPSGACARVTQTPTVVGAGPPTSGVVHRVHGGHSLIPSRRSLPKSGATLPSSDTRLQIVRGATLEISFWWRSSHWAIIRVTFIQLSNDYLRGADWERSVCRGEHVARIGVRLTVGSC